MGGALDVLAGAFRFTTGQLAKARPRDVAIRVGTATIAAFIGAGGYGAKVEATLDRRAALEGADAVLCTILSGGVHVWRYDVEIPKQFGVDINVGDTVLVDSGLIRLEVLEKQDAHIRCRVLIPGQLTSRRHINLPGVKINLPSFTEKDRADTMVGIEEGIDFVALSFVREAKDIEQLREFLRDHKSAAHIIAKIEDQLAVKNLEEIIAAADGLMILDYDAIQDHRGISRRNQFAVIAEVRDVEDDVVGLPLARGAARVGQRRVLSVNRARRTVGVGQI